MKECDKCKIKYDQTKLITHIHMIEGYSVQIYKCKCGHEQSHVVPRSKEKKSFWRSILG